MKNPVDLHIGQRVRNRRWLMNWTQQDLAAAIGVRFQQIQKYEKGHNRICASRLWELSQALDVPLSFFFEGLEGSSTNSDEEGLLDQKESIQLLRAYYGMGERARRTFLELARVIGNKSSDAVEAEFLAGARSAA